MELEPTTYNGRCLVGVLQNWLKKSPEIAHELLNRAFCMFALKLENQDDFLDALYGQKVLDEPPNLNVV